jgi:hypothetical protein
MDKAQMRILVAAQKKERLVRYLRLSLGMVQFRSWGELLANL